MFANYRTQSPEETILLGEKLASRLVPGDAVLLVGDLGAGKTHFAKGIAKGLGISMTIKSPTFAYVNRYPIGGSKIFYHYDLYRIEEGADTTSIGLEESLSDPRAIHAIEWAERLGGQFPNQYVMVRFEGDGKERTIHIEFIRPNLLPESAIFAYYEEWGTPQHVQRHCRAVTQVAMEVAEAIARKGEIINFNLLYPAAMLHDMARVCDFLHFDRAKFKEPVSDTLWNKWTKLREIYKGKRHAFIAHRQMMERGFAETAEVVRLHEADLIALEPNSYTTLESKILYYADKRVKHDQIVDLKERYRDGRERYGAGDTPKQKKLYLDVEMICLAMEKELFEGLDITPEDITGM